MFARFSQCFILFLTFWILLDDPQGVWIQKLCAKNCIQFCYEITELQHPPLRSRCSRDRARHLHGARRALGLRDRGHRGPRLLLLRARAVEAAHVRALLKLERVAPRPDFEAGPRSRSTNSSTAAKRCLSLAFHRALLSVELARERAAPRHLRAGLLARRARAADLHVRRASGRGCEELNVFLHVQATVHYSVRFERHLVYWL